MKVSNTRRAVLAGMAATPAGVAWAGQAPTQTPYRLEVGAPLERFDRLQPGVRSYLLSRDQPDGRHFPTFIAKRETRFETIDGQRRMRVNVQLDGATLIWESESVFEDQVFRPITHVRTITRDGTRTVEGYRFGPDGLTGLDIPDNIRSDLNIPFTEPMFNFETDLEMLRTLPWSAGYSVSIPFHHAGSRDAKRYLWTTSEAVARTPDGRDIECWVVRTDYDGSPQPSHFWLAKGTQELIRVETPSRDGLINRKTLLGV